MLLGKRSTWAAALVAASIIALSFEAPAQAFSANFEDYDHNPGCESWFYTSEANYAGDGYDNCSNVSLNDSITSVFNYGTWQDLNMWSNSYWRGTAYDIPTESGVTWLSGASPNNTWSSHEW